YEKSVVYQSCLIIPFVYSSINDQNIYSYGLLSEQGYNSTLHQTENPARLYANKIESIVAIASQHLDSQVIFEGTNYFQQRYTYHHNLIIIHQAADKFFYDHYASNNLTNIAAPKIFANPQDCINWVRAGLQRY
ncbi:MAG: hypothetical protein AAF383_30455, partial [Cyanobacteria bacterium P01_A01_bin.83]